MLIVHSVVMGINRKMSKVLALQIMFIHVSLHQQGVKRHEREAVDRLILLIRSGDHSLLHCRPRHVSHLLRACDDNDIPQAAGYSQISHPDCRTT